MISSERDTRESVQYMLRQLQEEENHMRREKIRNDSLYRLVDLGDPTMRAPESSGESDDECEAVNQVEELGEKSPKETNIPDSIQSNHNCHEINESPEINFNYNYDNEDLEAILRTKEAEIRSEESFEYSSSFYTYSPSPLSPPSSNIPTGTTRMLSWITNTVNHEDEEIDSPHPTPEHLAINEAKRCAAHMIEVPTPTVIKTGLDTTIGAVKGGKYSPITINKPIPTGQRLFVNGNGSPFRGRYYGSRYGPYTSPGFGSPLGNGSGYHKFAERKPTPLYFKHGISYDPNPNIKSNNEDGHDNKEWNQSFRTVLLTNLPDEADLFGVLDRLIRGGSVVRATLADTSPLTGSKSAYIVFKTDAAAERCVIDLNDIIASDKVKKWGWGAWSEMEVEVLQTATYPDRRLRITPSAGKLAPGEKEEKATRRYATRILVILNFRRSIPKLKVQADLMGLHGDALAYEFEFKDAEAMQKRYNTIGLLNVRVFDANEVDDFSDDEECPNPWTLEMKFSSIDAAVRGFQMLRQNSTYDGLDIKFHKDPCIGDFWREEKDDDDPGSGWDEFRAWHESIFGRKWVSPEEQADIEDVCNDDISGPSLSADQSFQQEADHLTPKEASNPDEIDLNLEVDIDNNTETHTSAVPLNSLKSTDAPSTPVIAPTAAAPSNLAIPLSAATNRTYTSWADECIEAAEQEAEVGSLSMLRMG